MFRRRVGTNAAAAATTTTTTTTPAAAAPTPAAVAGDAAQQTKPFPTTDTVPAPATLRPGAEGSEQQRYANGTVVAGLYRLDKTIGKGSYGKVKLATNLLTKERVAVKFIAKSSIRKPTHWTRIRREINLLKVLNHPHVVQLLDQRETEHDILLVLEYVPGADLFDRIVHHREQRYPEREARLIFRQLVSALDYCHENRVVHRDLKPENVMVDERNSIKLIDFGFANLFHPRGHLETNCGSPLYASPEIVQGVRYVGPEVDIWSLGVILYATLTGTLPFEDEQLKGLYAKICAGVFVMPAYLSASAKDLIRSMLTVDSRMRATMQQIKYHPWVCEGMAFPPKNFLPLRDQHVAPAVRDELLPLLSEYGFADAAATRSQIQHQLDSPAHAIYRLLDEKHCRDLAKGTPPVRAIVSPPPSPAKKPLPSQPGAHRSDPWVNLGATNGQVSINIDDELETLPLTPPATPQKTFLTDAYDSLPGPTGIVAQAAAHVANRIRKLKEMKFGGGTAAVSDLPASNQAHVRPAVYAGAPAGDVERQMMPNAAADAYDFIDIGSTVH